MNTVNGVITTRRTVLSVTWLEATVVPFPGGMFGPSTKTTSGRTIAVPITVSAAMRAPCPRLDHIDVPIHVADRLHRAAEPVDEAGGARDEALPAVVARLAGAEGERDRLVRVRQGARRLVALVGRVVADAHDRHDHAERRDRERVGGVVGIDQ